MKVVYISSRCGNQITQPLFVFTQDSPEATGAGFVVMVPVSRVGFVLVSALNPKY